MNDIQLENKLVLHLYQNDAWDTNSGIGEHLVLLEMKNWAGDQGSDVFVKSSRGLWKSRPGPDDINNVFLTSSGIEVAEKLLSHSTDAVRNRRDTVVFWYNIVVPAIALVVAIFALFT